MKGGKEGWYFSLCTKLLYLSLVLFTLGICLVVTSGSFAYDQYYTHPALTEEMAKLYNAKSTNSTLSSQDIEWLRKGAVEEDEPARWINHFYDPVHKTGWSGKHYGYLSQDDGYKRGADMAPKQALPSIEWVVNQDYQAAYGQQYGNQTWQKAINSYIAGDRQAAMTALGHVLHLVEDASVPDHTRDDSHPGIEGDPGSPYESTSKDFILTHQLTVADSLVKNNTDLPKFSTVQEAFEHIANYSNYNFFSEDTISNSEFGLPNLASLKLTTKSIDGIDINYLYSNDLYLARQQVKGHEVSLTTDDQYFVMPSYRSHLFPEDVLTGAGVIKLFFSEVERYKQHPELLKAVVPNTNKTFSDSLLVDAKRVVVKEATVAKKIYTDVSREASSFIAQVNTQMDQLNTQVMAGAKEGWNMIKVGFGFNAPTQPTPIVQIHAVVTQPVVAQTSTGAYIPLPVSIPVAKQNIVSAKSIVPQVLGEKIVNDTDANNSQILNLISELQSDEILNPTQEAGRQVQNDNLIKSPVNSLPYVSAGGGEVIYLLPQASASNNFSQTTPQTVVVVEPAPTQNAVSTTPIVSVPIIDVTPPTVPVITLSVQSTTLHVAVTSTDDFVLPIYFDVSFRTSTSNKWTSFIEHTTSSVFDLSADRGATYYIRSRAADEGGNYSEWSEQNVFVNWSGEVVMSEIAWAGTSALYPNDEWFELYNTTDQAIDVKNWKLYISGTLVGWTKINNSIIQPHDYMLFERGRDGVISDITADIVYASTNGFNNGGDKVELLKSNGEKTDEVDCSKGWFGGDTMLYRTTERAYFNGNGSDKASWQTNQGIRVLGRSFNGEQLHASPRQSNKGFIALNYKQEEKERHLIKDNNPYVLQYYEIPAGYTLTVDPGVIIKSYAKDAKVDIYGNLNVGGVGSPVVFTSGKDKKLNDPLLNTVVGTWTSTTTQPKDWQGIWFHPGSQGTMQNVQIKYAGNDFKVNNYIYTGLVSQAIRSEQAAVNLVDSFVKDSGGIAWHMENSSSTIANALFQNGDRAIDAYDSDISMTSSSVETFLNTQAPFYSKGRWPQLNNVSFANNVVNAPLLESVVVTRDTYVAPESVFTVNNATVNPSTTLHLSEGVKLLMTASSGIDVRGSLMVDGTADKPVYIIPQVTSSYWSTIQFTSSNSQLSHVFISGGNKLSVPINQGAMLSFVSSTISLNDCTLINNRTPGNTILSKNSTVHLNGCGVGFSQKPSLSTTAIQIENSIFTIKNSQFMNTAFGFYGIGNPLSNLTFDTVTTSFSGVDYPFEPKPWLVSIEN